MNATVRQAMANWVTLKGRHKEDNTIMSPQLLQRFQHRADMYLCVVQYKNIEDAIANNKLET